MAGFNLGDIFVTLKADGRTYTKSLGDAQRATAGFSEKAQHGLSSITAVAKKVAVGMAAVGTAASVAGGFAVKSAAQFQQTRVGLENMLGSADKARALLKDVSKFAAETPFEFPELAQATRQLVAFGFSGQQAFDTMKQLGDVSAAVGTPINDLAYLMGTLRTQGRAFTIDIRQFAQRGIPIYEYLAKVFKTNTKEVTELIEAGKVGFPEVQKAFKMMTAEGGKFHGTMEKQSRTLNGMWSTFKDLIGQTARELIGITQEGDIKEGSIFARLQGGLEWINANLPAIISTFKSGISSVVPILQEWGRSIFQVASRVGEYLMPKLQRLFWAVRDDLIPTLRELWQDVGVPLAKFIGVVLVVAVGALVDVLGWLARNLDDLMPLLAAFGTLLMSAKITGAIVGVTTAISGAGGLIPALGSLKTVIASKALITPWGLIAAAGVGAAVLLIDKWGDVRRQMERTKTAIDNSRLAADSAIKRFEAAVKEGKTTRKELNKLKQSLQEGQQEVLKTQGDWQYLLGIFDPRRWGGDKGNPLNSIKGSPQAGNLRGNASGGFLPAGVPSVVGEMGREVIVPAQDSKVIPNHLAGGGGVQVRIGAIYDKSDANYILRQLSGAQHMAKMGVTPVGGI